MHQRLRHWTQCGVALLLGVAVAAAGIAPVAVAGSAAAPGAVPPSFVPGWARGWSTSGGKVRAVPGVLAVPAGL